MGKELNLKIVLPSRTFLEEKVASVIIPAVRADVNILPDRAPSVFALDFGVVRVLNPNGSIKADYFVHSGMAEVVDNNCDIMVQGVAVAAELNVAEAKKRLEKAETPQMQLFYQMILDHQRNVRRRYLRTLQLYAKKLKQKNHFKKTVSSSNSKKQ